MDLNPAQELEIKDFTPSTDSSNSDHILPIPTKADLDTYKHAVVSGTGRRNIDYYHQLILIFQSPALKISRCLRYFRKEGHESDGEHLCALCQLADKCLEGGKDEKADRRHIADSGPRSFCQAFQMLKIQIALY